ncbi:MAG: hypothetical protein EXQ86_07910 [Rhodospirillales bacterium]|nr:hypothetical protein [Rhodospirillales bacterium]
MVWAAMRRLAAAAVILLPACAFTEETLWPSLTGNDPAGDKKKEAARPQSPTPGRSLPAQQAQAPMAPLSPASVEAPPPTTGADTGTLVGKKAGELRAELQRLQGLVAQHNAQLQQLRARIVQDAQRYHATLANMNSRLQVGTTPGNPILVQQFNSAQADLERLNNDIAEVNKLASSIGDDAALSGFLGEATKASFSLSGAVDEDHRQLAILEDEVNRTAVLIDRLLKEVTDDVRRQTNYVATERSNLNLIASGIKSGEFYGLSLINQAMASAGSGREGNVAGAPADVSDRRPLVVIRFDRANVPYQQALYNAVSKVLERRPDAVFDLVAVAPTAGGPARESLNSTKSRRHAEDVLRSLTEMGLPPARVAVSAKALASAKTNEVHLYLR